jgi:hypothetical protein
VLLQRCTIFLRDALITIEQAICVRLVARQLLPMFDWIRCEKICSIESIT